MVAVSHPLMPEQHNNRNSPEVNKKKVIWPGRRITHRILRNERAGESLMRFRAASESFAKLFAFGGY